jgi:hypothetical protein
VGKPPEAKMLDVILYSRDQLIQERDAMASKQVRAVQRRREHTREEASASWRQVERGEGGACGE